MLTKTRLAVLVVLFALVAAVFATVKLLPRRYWIADQLYKVAVFWHEDEAFVFLQRHATGRSTNAVVERLPQDSWWGSLAAMYFDWQPLGSTTTAYRLAGAALERHELENATVNPAWDLEDGRLVARGRVSAETEEGFRWTGTGFARLPRTDTAAPPRRGAQTVLPDDDEDADVVHESGPISAEARARFKGAGWHFKHLYAYQAVNAPAVLAIPLRSRTATLTLRTAAPTGFGFTSPSTVELAADGLAPPARPLFDGGAWTEVPRAAFEARAAASPSRAPSASIPISALLLLLLWLGFLVLKVAGVAGLIGAPALFGLKRQLVRSVGTTMTLPPTIPEQFPRLDRERLDATSRELEGLGFERLLDTSPVTDAKSSPPTFCRIYAHRRHACYAIAIQSFPQAGRPTDLRCMIHGYLDDGWTVGHGNGKALAASVFVRRPRTIGVNVADASPAELLGAFLHFRERVCGDLGVQPVADTSLENYIRRTQEDLQDIRKAVKKKNVTVGLGQLFALVLRSRRAGSTEVWLGDYPKVAEERRAAGVGPGFTYHPTHPERMVRAAPIGRKGAAS